ncbi:MAG: peptidyl-prolyl cis-trans isomerase [Burkholderiales bacterium]|nr:peptidyl-prolyl cis-trans isomerase [Burkholderiales bacterium]
MPPMQTDTPSASLVRDLLARRAIALGLADAGPEDSVPDAAIERLLEQEVRTPEPTEEECSRYYTVHEDEFVVGELVAASHILFAVTPGAPAVLIRTKAEQVLARLGGEPEAFAECAASMSNCPSGSQGGQLGQLSRGQSVPEFEQALFDASRPAGILPRLVNTRFGFHIVRIDQRIAGKALPYEHVRTRIAEQLTERVQHSALVQYVRVLAGEEGTTVPGIDAATSPLVQ